MRVIFECGDFSSEWLSEHLPRRGDIVLWRNQHSGTASIRAGKYRVVDVVWQYFFDETNVVVVLEAA